MSTELENLPLDQISNIQFSPIEGDYHLVVSAWDGTCRVYDTMANEVKMARHVSHAVLDCSCMRSPTKVAFGGLGKQLYVMDEASNEVATIGGHDEAIRCVEHHSSTGLIFTGGWDRLLKAWDPRSRQCVSSTNVGGKVFCMSTSDGRVVVGNSAKQIYVYDVRMLQAAEQIRDASLKYQLRSLRCFPNGLGFAAASVEGRVAWEYFDQNETAKKYAFKCHRETVDNIENVFPVNALAFHPTYGTFATGGADGLVSVWDGNARKRLFRLPKYPTSVSSLGFSSDGTRLAVAVSYTFEEGEKDPMPPNQITVRQISDQDVKPK